jgi:hypothetical protein
MKRLTQILLVLSLGFLTLPGFAQENQPLSYRQPVVSGRAQANFASWRVVLVFRGGRWHRRALLGIRHRDYWQARRGYWQARRWRWEGRRWRRY